MPALAVHSEFQAAVCWKRIRPHDESLVLRGALLGASPDNGRADSPHWRPLAAPMLIGIGILVMSMAGSFRALC